jgi:hypothetical protein
MVNLVSSTYNAYGISYRLKKIHIKIIYTEINESIYFFFQNQLLPTFLLEARAPPERIKIACMDRV